jgi:hypothetical protein
MTQTISYVVDVKGAQAAAGQVEKVEAAFHKTEVAATQAGRAMDVAAKPTRNLGQAGLEASRALEDLQYGIGGIVNNIPSLVMSLGGGAGLTAAISLAAVGVNQLYKEFSAVPDATKTAVDTAKSYIDDLQKEIADLGRDLRLVQIGATGVAMEEQRKRIQVAMVEARAVIDAVGGPERLARLRELTGDRAEMLPSRGFGPLASRNYVSPEAFNAAIEAQKKLDLEIKKMQQIQLIELEKSEKEAATTRGEKAGRAYIEGVITAMADPRSEAMAGMFSQAGLRGTVAGNIAEAEMEAEITAAAERKSLQLRSLETDQMIQRLRTEVAEEESKKREAIAKHEGETLSRAISTTATTVVDGLVGIAAGQEGAVEAMITSLSRQAGGFITLEGGKALSAGIAGASLGNPMAPGQIATGIGLIAAGAAVAAGGPAAVSALMGKGQTGSTSPSGAMRDPGASPRTSGGGTGGPLVLNVTYGVAGPLPEDTARAIHRELRSGDRRSGR